MIPFTQSDLYFARKIFSVDEQSLYTQKIKTSENTIIKRQRDEF